MITVALQQNVHQSILSADEIAAVKAADPAAADLLYRMIERQQTHDHSMEEATLHSESIYRLAGIATALVVIGAQLGVAAIALTYDHANIAALFGGSAVLTSIAGVFIRGRGLAAEKSAPTIGRPMSASPEQQIPTQAPAPPR